MNINSRILLCLAILLLVIPYANAGSNDPSDNIDFDDKLLSEELVYPDWFKLSLGNLKDDLEEAVAANKTGLIVYFGQKRCAYCEQFLKTNLGTEDIQHYVRENYDIVPVDIWGINDITDTDGTTYSERELSVHYKTTFTPSLIFYDKNGKPVYRLRGYYPPYKFRAALKYVAEGFYKKESFRDYLARAVPGTFFLLGGLNEREFFQQPPYDLQQTIKQTQLPLVVFFEQGKCHACDLLHTGPLNKKDTLAELRNLSSVQLDMWSDTPVTKPDGTVTTAKEWAKQLELFHAPTLVFFDPNGKEIIRLDSVVKFYRLWGVLDYVNEGGYKSEKDYQAWRLKQRKSL